MAFWYSAKRGDSWTSSLRGRGRSMSRTPSTRPGRGDMTTTLSERRTASGIECVMNTTVFRRSSQSRSMSSRICSRVKASSAPNGSSIRSSGGSWMSARQIAARWRIPPDSSNGYLSSNPSRPTACKSSRAFARWLARSSPRASTWSSTFRMTVRQSRRTGFWNTMPTSVWGPVTGRPARRISPDDGGRSPAIMRSSVLLPQPDGPRIDRNSPAGTSSETCSTAWTSPSDAG